jgi:AraC family transcriptional regulator of adaptative response / DNA-3-methyladenine glycosylase II
MSSGQSCVRKLRRNYPDDAVRRLCYGNAMRMTDATMYARVLASDASCNGRFFFGVTSTGIYCLTSRHAKKPRAENTRFFPTAEAARAAGLRACKKCHPDDFARGADPVLETIESLVGEVRATPQNVADARAIVRRSGFGATRVFELFRQHYHTTPADLLLRARIDEAKKRLLATSVGLAAVSVAVGFESLSVFHGHFHRLNRLTPAAYRELREARTFAIALPAGFLLGNLRRAMSRDIHSASERLVGDVYTTVVQFGSGPALVKLTLSPQSVQVSIADGSAPEAHAWVIGLLGLDEDAAAFARLAKRLGLARLVAGRAELRISQTPSVFDGLLWSIIGQQINFPFACLLKRRLVELTGKPFADGLYAPPTPEAVAALEPAALLPLQFSRRKADYVIQTARLVASGKLDLAALRTMSATRAERTLLAVRGLGPWSVNYLLMRSLGFPDCVPLGDTGVTSGLQALLKLEERPDIDATRRLMAVFAPYRSLATAHLWQFNQPIP